MKSELLNRIGLVLVATFLVSQFLFLLPLTAAALSRNGLRQSSGSPMRWGRLRFTDQEGQKAWSYHPEGDLNLIRNLRSETDINLAFDFGVPHVDSLDEMVSYPLIFMHGQHPVHLKEAHRSNLREYLRRGGFLFIDDCVLSGSQPDLFFRSMLLELPKILPGVRMTNLENDRNHEIFHCFYDMPDGAPHAQGRDHGLIGIYDGDRLVGVLSSSDLHCAWAQLLGSRSEQECLRMATNIYVYAMTH
jgi:hypothetical protein